MEEKFYELEIQPEGILWKAQHPSSRPKAYCKQHLSPLHPEDPETLYCLKGGESFNTDVPYLALQSYARDLIFTHKLSDLKIVRIDSQGAPVLAKERNETLPGYFIESKLSDTRKGLELMVQVGKKDQSDKKVQLFVDLPAERMGFDKSSKDKHPVGLFAEVTAIFNNSISKIKKKK